MTELTFSPTRPYADQRAALMALICPRDRGCHVCHHCGRRARLHTSMEFDHRGHRAWQPNRLNRWSRLRRYYRDWLAAGRALGSEGGVVGVGVVGACTPCNRRGGAERTNSQARSGTKTPHGRRRGRRGAGYTDRAYHDGLAAHYALQAARVPDPTPVPF